MIDGHVTLPAARPVVACHGRNAFEQGRLPGSVLANDDRDGVIEFEIESLLKKRQTERIDGSILNARLIEPDAVEIWRRQIDRSCASRHVTTTFLRLPAAR